MATATTTTAKRIPLGIRKRIRDNFERKIPQLEKELNAALYVDNSADDRVRFDWDIEELYWTWAKSTDHKEGFGSLMFCYAEQVLRAVEEAKKDGDEKEFIDTLFSVFTDRRILFREDPKVDYCGFGFRDGAWCILVKEDRFGTNINLYYGVLAQALDSASEMLDVRAIPWTTRRIEQKELLPKLEKHKKQLHDIFGRDIALSYDLRSSLDVLRANLSSIEQRSYQQDGRLNKSLPGDISLYFYHAIGTLERLGFGRDPLLKDAFLKAAPKGILFEVVPTLRSDSAYNECAFHDGYFKLRTIPKYFGSLHGEIADKALDQL